MATATMPRHIGAAPSAVSSEHVHITFSEELRFTARSSPHHARTAFLEGVRLAASQCGITKVHCEVRDHPRPPVSEDMALNELIVLVQSTPTDGDVHTLAERQYIRSAFGVPLPVWVGDGLKSSGRGLPMCDDAGTVVADVLPAGNGLPTYIYILFRLTAQEFAQQQWLTTEIVRRALGQAQFRTAVAETITETAEGEERVIGDFPAILAHPPLPAEPVGPDQEQARQARWIDDRKTLDAIIAARAVEPFDAVVAARAAAVADAEAAADALVAEAREAVEAFAANELRGDAAAAHLRTIRDRIGREFDTLCASPKVDRLGFSGDTFIVRTKPLVIDEPTHGFPHFAIGSWEIRIPRVGDEVRIFSLDSRLRNLTWPHPHVTREGVICWGNVKAEITHALRTHDYDVAVLYFVQLLETGIGNPSEAQTHLSILRGMRQFLMLGDDSMELDAGIGVVGDDWEVHT